MPMPARYNAYADISILPLLSWAIWHMEWSEPLHIYIWSSLLLLMIWGTSAYAMMKHFEHQLPNHHCLLDILRSNFFGSSLCWNSSMILGFCYPSFCLLFSHLLSYLRSILFLASPLAFATSLYLELASFLFPSLHQWVHEYWPPCMDECDRTVV